MESTTPEQNKEIVLKAFDTLFNKRDYEAARQFWSDNFIQHSAYVEPGQSGLFDAVRASPSTIRYENSLAFAKDAFVMLHGRFSGYHQPAAWIAANIMRVENGRIAEHWDVLQAEATKAESKSGLPMFGDSFPTKP